MLTKISQYLTRIQTEIFPFLENNLGELTIKHQEVIQAIELVELHRYLPVNYRGVGRPAEDRFCIANAFLAKAILGIGKTKDLIERLKVDKQLRHICGWPHGGKIASETTFSRVFRELSELEVIKKAHGEFVKQALQENLVFNLSRDSTSLSAREKAIYKPKVIKQKTKLGRPKKGEERRTVKEKRLQQQTRMGLEEMLSGLSQGCDYGVKKNSKGFKTKWKGYKLHLDITDTGIPVSAILTSASVHDSQVALPLARMSNE